MFGIPDPNLLISYTSFIGHFVDEIIIHTIFGGKIFVLFLANFSPFGILGVKY